MINEELELEVKKEARQFFKSREKFLKEQVDKNVYAQKCEKHNVFYGKHVKQCPLCKLEALKEKHRAEIKEKDLFIGRSTVEHLKIMHDKDVARCTNYVRNKLNNDAEFKENWKKRSLEFARKREQED